MKANTRAIGAFVVGAAVLLFGSVALFASTDFFEQERRFVAYFEQSVNGLNVGAPVKFRGIPIGEVEEIEGVYNPETSAVRPRVVIAVSPERMTNARLEGDEYTLFQGLVANGMRGSLKSQSILTGQLYVSLDFYEKEPVRLLGSSQDEHPEMPTVETGLGEFIASIQDLPLDQVIAQVGSTLASLERVLADDELALAIDELPQLIADLRQTAKGINQFTRNDLPVTTKELRSLLNTSERSVERLTKRIDTKTLSNVDKTLSNVDKTLSNLDNTFSILDSTLGEADKTLAKVRDRLDPNDPLTLELTNTMREVSDAASSVRRLTEFIETHPEALIRGREE